MTHRPFFDQNPGQKCIFERLPFCVKFFHRGPFLSKFTAAFSLLFSQVTGDVFRHVVFETVSRFVDLQDGISGVVW